MLQDTALYIRILVPKLNLYISVQKYSPLHAHQTQTVICAEDIAFVQPVSIHSAFTNADANARANPTHPLYSTCPTLVGQLIQTVKLRQPNQQKMKEMVAF